MFLSRAKSARLPRAQGTKLNEIVGRLNSDVTVMSSYEVMYDVYTGTTGWNFFFTATRNRKRTCGARIQQNMYYGKQHFQTETRKRKLKDK